MEKVRTGWLILIFALLHFATAAVCRMLDADDTMLLTLLTMTLTVLICLRERISLEFIGLSIVLVNIIGYAAGTGFAALMKLFISNGILRHAISTFLTTEMLGWMIYGATKISFAKSSHARRQLTSDFQVRWIIFAVGLIYLIRVIINVWSASGGQLKETGGDIVGNSIALLIFVADIIFISNSTRKAMEAERGKANKARFQYMNLKQQVNPHFLFNSLNVLDALVCDGTKEEASTYIHKLAGLYRYMLRNEGEELVSLSDELEYARMYLALLRVRFPEGIRMEEDIRPEDLSRMVVPCSVQLLLENATKHNAFSASEPLLIRISSDNNTLLITNNLRLRLTPSSSTGLGLKYIRQQYLDHSGAEVLVQKSDAEFSVSLPLL
ncbi:MAG: histidine kinase [Bacteroidales bacterium]|nr:histidine kinase [Bacteroidales bacterium]